MSQSRQSQSQPATTPVPTSPILPPSATSARATPLPSSPVIQAPLSSPPALPSVPAAIQHQHSQDCHAPYPGTSLAGSSPVSSHSNDAALVVASAAPPLPPPPPTTRHSKAPARIATHMPDSFHSKFDNEQNHLREKQTREMERKERELREKYEVIVHCLLKDGEQPVHQSFQDSSSATQFVFSRAHLDTLGLVDNGTSSSTPVKFKIYRIDEDLWVSVSDGYSALVPANRHLFVIASGVQDHDALNSVISHFSRKFSSTLHLCNGLAQERRDVRVQAHMSQIESAMVIKSSKRTSRVAPHPSLGPAPASSSSSSLSRKVKPRPVLKKRKYSKHEVDFVELTDDDDVKHDVDFIEITDDDNVKHEHSTRVSLPPEVVGQTFSLLSESSSEDDAEVRAEPGSGISVGLDLEEKANGTSKSHLNVAAADALHHLASSSSSDRRSRSPQQGVPNSDPNAATRVWPCQFDCAEMFKGFTDFNENISSLSMEEVFFRAFPSARFFVKTTFYENQDRWYGVPIDVRCAAIAAKTSWPNFQKQNPSDKAGPRAARKVLQRQTKDSEA
ncbi:hypothetical protein BDY19DRAFT_998990 [Irpex rosettiformis]|uniref:Uncharacterized protein n=1 Tax=Irpex rosettiformis TaxID=378272 RepID=A0ACB8TLY1_9APHY|nr:hypothetical protein BDY19DRAFT_998990 [Irpex rosettiformis]